MGGGVVTPSSWVVGWRVAPGWFNFHLDTSNSLQGLRVTMNELTRGEFLRVSTEFDWI